MNIGKARHKLTIQKPISADDGGGGGGSGKDWETFTTVWAQVEPLRATKILRADKSQVEVTHLVKNMRYRSDLKDNMRFIHNGRALNIENIINVDERNIEFEIMCIEGEADD